MLAFLTALAEALPAAGKFIDAVTKSDQKASTAAKVAADPKAPPDVKQAATNVAAQAIDDKAAVEKAALNATSGAAKPAGGGGVSTATLVLIGAGLLLLSKRRR
jgi:hypothetical protein